MPEAKHTPGPWKHVRESGDGKFQVVESDQEKNNWDCLRCKVESDDCNYEMAVANAKLIAAAPDLYEALKGVLLVADRATVEFDAARAALAKAEGRTN